MKTIRVNEYDGNDFNRSREAKLYENGTIEYLPEPDYEEEEHEQVTDQEEDEEECMMKS
jgi:hypothetical protein